MSNMKKIDLNQIYVFNEKDGVYETVQINPLPFADELKGEAQKHSLHGAHK